MLADVRQRRIVELVERFGWVEVGELASSLDVSQVTVRRDLDLLDKLNLLERRRGGAVSVNAPFEVESTYQDKSQENLEAKMCIRDRYIGRAAHLLMSERVDLHLADTFRDDLAVGRFDAFGDGDHDVLALRIDAFDVFQHLVEIERNLRQVDQFGTIAFFGRERRGCRQPAGVTTHDFQHDDHAAIVHS